jgi:hypothetical protein
MPFVVLLAPDARTALLLAERLYGVHPTDAERLGPASREDATRWTDDLRTIRPTATPKALSAVELDRRAARKMLL